MLTSGMCVICPHAEWLVTSVEAAGREERVVYCVGAEELTRGHETAFLTQFDTIEPVDHSRTSLVLDESGGSPCARTEGGGV